jgi:Tfp pilus assembly protein PilV
MKSRKYKRHKRISSSAGFTLLETLVAIFILVLTMGSLLTLASGGIFSVRYSRNQIVASNLLQESMETVRNSRDTAAQSPTYTWNGWLATFNVNQSGVQQDPSSLTNGCFTSNGCYVDAYVTPTVKACSSTCTSLTYYPESGFYGYSNSTYPLIETGGAYVTTYARKIRFIATSNPDQYIVTGQITWKNGNIDKSLTQSMLLTNWKP